MPRNGNGPRQSYNKNKQQKKPHKSTFKSPPLPMYQKFQKAQKKDTLPPLFPLLGLQAVALEIAAAAAGVAVPVHVPDRTAEFKNGR